MKLWLSPEFLDWNRNLLNPKISKDWDFLKPYELLKHANKKLDEVDDKENPDEENPALGEVVYQLRRAVEHREKQLAEKFNLSELPFEVLSNKKKPRTEERLYELDVIKPILRSKLNRLRNIITHEQKDPYSKDKSEIIELSEFTWYFIRSTDAFLAREISGTIFYPPDFSEPEPDSLIDEWAYSERHQYPGCFLVRISPKHKWEVNIQGYGVPINLFSKSKKDGWLELAVNEIDAFIENLTPDEIAARYRFALEGLDDAPPALPTEDERNAEREKILDEYFSSGKSIWHFEGALIGSSKALKFFIHKYFELYMYY